MKRRNFCKTLGLAGAGVVAGCKTTQVYSPAVRQGNTLIVEKALFEQREAIMIEAGRFPIGVYKLGRNEFSASLMSCTHQACQTAFFDEGYVCPCHGSRFTKRGQVVKGPAKVDLTQLALTGDERFLYIEQVD